MALRCLLFSSNEEMVQPIWQVLTDLGIEGEYCRSAVDAVEKVTTQLFQIVITDWEDQPEAAFLLKTARDLKAAQRPLTLAIVSEDARLPEALQAGANSVLIKPIRLEQVRDTMSTACELLRSKLALNSTSRETTVAMAAAASAGGAPAATASAASSSAAAAPASVTKAPENAFRAGEFLQSRSSAPGEHFDTESEVQKSLDQAAAEQVDALTDLEPVAAAVQEAPLEQVEPEAPLTGWAALQARLTKSAPPPAEDAVPKNELLSYAETASHGSQTASPGECEESAHKDSQPEAKAEAALFAYMSGESKEDPEPPQERPKRSKAVIVGALALACVGVVAVPRARQSLEMLYRGAVRAGGGWLNPQPVPVPQSPPQHDSFGQAGDEYKLPVARNIPDATTDPSQIRVLPVIDPTAKVAKGSEANSQQPQAGDETPSDQNQTEQVQPGQSSVSEPTAPTSGDTPGSASAVVLTPVTAPVQGEPNAPVMQAVTPSPRPVAPPVQSSAPPHAVSVGSSTPIPSSLKSRTASITPEASGAMPVEAAMSSIEPVKLPESSAWGLLAQPVDPVYPDAAKASKQQGTVILQVLIGRDGVVQDAKFLQGSLVFARAAIDAVKQWRFKPYSLNGRTVSVQSVITLNFKPPA